MKQYKPLIVVILAFLGFSLMFHASVQALELPENNRPIATAIMQPTTASGLFSNVGTVNLIVAQGVRSILPTSIKVVIDGEVHELPINSINEDDCGSVIIQASGGYPDSMQEVVLKDNSTRYCIDEIADQWDASLKVIGFAGSPIGQMIMTGTPEPTIAL